MNVRFACPSCGYFARLTLPTESGWHCPGCTQPLTAPTATSEGKLTACAVCGTEELYRKKDFPHWLGLTILAAACLAFMILSLLYLQWWAWAILLGSAVFDGALYLLVGDAIVCYRCQAHYRRVPLVATIKPFDLGIHERYRQERIRREQMKRSAEC